MRFRATMFLFILLSTFLLSANYNKIDEEAEHSLTLLTNKKIEEEIIKNLDLLKNLHIVENLDEYELIKEFMEDDEDN